MENLIDHLIEKHGLSHVREEILEAVFSCISVKPKKAEKLAVGASKMGGLADLPKQQPYPAYKGNPLHFIAQFNLTDLAEMTIKHELPKEGMLYFFYYDDWEAEETVWGEKEQRDGWRVIYYNGNIEELEPRDEGVRTYPQCVVSFREIKQLPFIAFDDDEDFNKFDELFSEFLPEEGTNHQIAGRPHEVQGEVFEECESFSGKGDDESDWTLLLQVDSDEENLEMMWGDVGMLYFCILTEDLKNKRFEEAWCIMQCH